MRAAKNISTIALLFAVGFSALAVPAPPRNTVCRPTFTTTAAPFGAGTAFVCDYPEAKTQLLITAHHLFGPAGGLPAKVAWNEMSAKIKQVDAVSLHDPAIHFVSSKVVQIDGARATDSTGVKDDIAVFALPEARDRAALKLADKAPKVGDQVWLYGAQADSKVIELIPATVTMSSDEELDYAFGVPALKLRATSGAPVLDADGNVVAINLGSTTRRAKLVGFGNPMMSIRKHLGKAFGKE